MTPARARQIALALPGVAEQDHHGFRSFRVAGKIFDVLAGAWRRKCPPKLPAQMRS